MLDIKIDKQPDARVRIALGGRLDTQTYLQCEQRLAPLLLSPNRVFVLDMARLDYMSSMGLRVLMKTNKTILAAGGKLLLTNLQAPIRAVIEIANALPSQNIFASVEEADRYLDLMQRRAREEAPGSPDLKS